MKNLFTPEQTQKLVPYFFQKLVGKTKYISPYPILEVGFVRPELLSDGNYEIYVGVYPFQLEFPEFMGHSDHQVLLWEFLKEKGILFPSEKLL